MICGVVQMQLYDSDERWCFKLRKIRWDGIGWDGIKGKIRYILLFLFFWYRNSQSRAMLVASTALWKAKCRKCGQNNGNRRVWPLLEHSFDFSGAKRCLKPHWKPLERDWGDISWRNEFPSAKRCWIVTKSNNFWGWRWVVLKCRKQQHPMKTTYLPATPSFGQEERKIVFHSDNSRPHTLIVTSQRRRELSRSCLLTNDLVLA